MIPLQLINGNNSYVGNTESGSPSTKINTTSAQGNIQINIISNFNIHCAGQHSEGTTNGNDDGISHEIAMHSEILSNVKNLNERLKIQ
jgi:hypothetical protein